jgi:serine/threonine-protein kinase
VTHPSAEFIDLQAALAGEYSLQRELGRGGMGVVYLARDVQLDRDVAIKVLPTHLADIPEARERFVREARTAAGLSHPHIVPIHRVGEAGGFVFFVMSYVDGETLGERLRTRGPLPPAEATRVMREVAWALAYAHGRGIVHRDVKPDNILLEAGTGRALVTDFGIAHRGRDPGPVTDPGKIMGTAQFMSPEQAAGGALDGRSDIYALGVVGHLAVSGRLPFESANLPALLLRQSTESAPSDARRTWLPPALAAAIDRCLARDPAERFTDGEALAEALAAPDARPALPPTLRAWLGARNPLLVPYMAWSGLFGTLTTVNLAVWLAGKRPDGPGDIVLLAAVAALPLFPIVGFHLNQARRQFRAGHTHPTCGRRSDRSAGTGRDRSGRSGRKRAHRAPGPANRHGCLRELARGHLRVGSAGSHPRKPGRPAVHPRARGEHHGAGSREQRARRAVHSHADSRVVADRDS